MDDPSHPTPRPPVTDRPLSSFVVGMLVVASVPVALWALANPSVAVVLAGVTAVVAAVATRRIRG